MEEDQPFILDFDINDVFLLHDCVKKRLETWERSPARPPEEQEHLWALRDNLYRCI